MHNIFMLLEAACQHLHSQLLIKHLHKLH